MITVRKRQNYAVNIKEIHLCTVANFKETGCYYVNPYICRKQSIVQLLDAVYCTVDIQSNIASVTKKLKYMQYRLCLHISLSEKLHQRDNKNIGYQYKV